MRGAVQRVACLALALAGCSAGPAPARPAPAPPASLAAATPAPSPAAPIAEPPQDLPPVEVSKSRFIEHVTLSPIPGTLALWCGYTCGNVSGGGLLEEVSVVHLWRMGEGGLRTVHVYADPAPASLMQFSPGGSTLLVAFESAVVVLAASGEELHRFEAQALYGNAVVSPDERWIMTASVFGELRLMDRASGRVMRSAQSRPATASVPSQVQWAPSSDRVVLAEDGSAPVLWDPAAGRAVATLSVKGARFEGRTATLFLPDGGLLVAGTHGVVAVFDSRKGTLREVLRQDRKDLTESWRQIAEMSDDGRRVAVGGTLGDAAWIDVATRRLTELSAADGEAAMGLKWSPDGEILAFQKSTVLREVRVTTGDRPAVLPGTIIDVAQGGLVITKSDSEEIVALSGGKERWRLKLPATPLEVTPDPSHQWLFVTDGRLRVVRVRDGKSAVFELKGEGSWVGLAPVGLSAREVREFFAAP